MPRRVAPPPVPKTHGDMPLSVIQQAIRAEEAKQQGGEVTTVVARPALKDFIAVAWPHVEGRRPFLPNWHLDAVAQHLTAVSDGQIDKLVVNMPPGMAKSIVGSVMWPAWDWGPNCRPERRWLCVSYGGDSASPANRDAERCRDLVISRWYQGDWGTVFRLSDTQNAKSFFANDHKGYRISTGLEGEPTGQRADIVLIDDPTKMDETSSDAMLRPSDIYERTLSHRAIDDGSAMVLLMSRLHEDDLAGYLLKQDGWVHLRLPMLYETEHKCRVFLKGTLFFEDPRTVEGQPLHERMNAAVAKAEVQRLARPDIFVAEQQQRPEAIQIRLNMQHWAPPLPHWNEVIITVDCAFKDGKENSWVVFQKWGRRDANAYLLDQYRRHMDLPETLDALVRFSERPPVAPGKYVESKANGVGVVQMLRNRLPGLMGTDDDETLKPFVAGSKEAKFQSVRPYINAGNVFAPPLDSIDMDGTPWVAEYLHELRTFPGRFDDQVDATSIAIWKLLNAYEAFGTLPGIMAIQQAGNRSQLVGLWDTAYGHAAPAGAGEPETSMGVTIGGVGILSGLESDAFGRRR